MIVCLTVLPRNVITIIHNDMITYLSWNSLVHLSNPGATMPNQEGGKGTENKQEKVKFRPVLTGIFLFLQEGQGQWPMEIPVFTLSL